VKGGPGRAHGPGPVGGRRGGPGAGRRGANPQDRASCEGLIRETEDRFGGADILVYATGTNIPQRSLQALTPERTVKGSGQQSAINSQKPVRFG